MKIKHLVAACAAVVAVGAASAATVPGGDLGSLTALPAQFFSLSTSLTPTLFQDTYTFSLGSNSSVFGSVSALIPGVTFSQVSLDGTAGTFTPVNSNQGFSFTNIGAGTHTLKVTGSLTSGFSGYIGSAYATPTAVPEPESVALVIGGLGVVSMVARRRQQAR